MGPELAKKVSIVITTLGKPCLWDCLRSVIEKTPAGYEMVIVCDKPNDVVYGGLYGFGARLIINPYKVGVPNAVNMGIMLTSTPYIVLMNDDIIVETRDWIVPLVEALEAHPEFGMVSPRVKRPGSEGKTWFAAIGEGSMLSQRMTRDVGLFDNDMAFRYMGTDADYFMRCHAAGYEFHGVDDVWVEHLVGRTIVEMFREDISHKLAMEMCQGVDDRLKAKYDNVFPDQHILPVYKGEE